MNIYYANSRHIAKLKLIILLKYDSDTNSLSIKTESEYHKDNIFQNYNQKSGCYTYLNEKSR